MEWQCGSGMWTMMCAVFVACLLKRVVPEPSTPGTTARQVQCSVQTMCGVVWFSVVWCSVVACSGVMYYIVSFDQVGWSIVVWLCV
jgi:hypothetical protein